MTRTRHHRCRPRASNAPSSLRFEPRGIKTRVTLFHAGWGSLDGADGKEWEATFQYFDKAWTSVLENLQKRYAPGGKPMDWTEWTDRMKKASTTR